MRKHMLPILGCVLVAFLAFAIGRSQAQKPQDQDDHEPDPLDNKPWVARMKLEFAQRKPDLQTLAVKRRDAARANYDARWREFATGRVALDAILIDASKKLLEAELAVIDKKAERLTAIEKHWLRTLKAEEYQQAKFKVGTIGPGEYHSFVLLRLEAEMQLVKAQKE